MRKRIDCLRYTGKDKCHFTGEICTDTQLENCKDYRTEEGLYQCPYCNLKGLKLMDYGNDKVWECLRCGGELWFCETLTEMKKRCEEIQDNDSTNSRNDFNKTENEVEPYIEEILEKQYPIIKQAIINVCTGFTGGAVFGFKAEPENMEHAIIKIHIENTKGAYHDYHTEE